MGDERGQAMRNVVASGVKNVRSIGEDPARLGSKVATGASADPDALIRSFLTAALPAASLVHASTAATVLAPYSFVPTSGAYLRSSAARSPLPKSSMQGLNCHVEVQNIV